jgi:NAD(P)-dependent dehydrogenase (short-subunit alcohol dehydrogenase family)
VAEKIRTVGREAIVLHQDVSFEESWPGVIAAAERRFGRLDVMVANAGIGILCRAIEMSLADWRRQTAVNLDGVFLSVKIRSPSNAPRRRRLHHYYVVRRRPPRLGRVGGLLRDKGRHPPVREGSRDGMRGGWRWYRINTVHPGVIDTPIWMKIPASTGSNAPIDPNEVARAGVPLGRAGQAQDIANGVLFLVSDTSNYTTGAEQ